MAANVGTLAYRDGGPSASGIIQRGDGHRATKSHLLRTALPERDTYTNPEKKTFFTWTSFHVVRVILG